MINLIIHNIKTKQGVRDVLSLTGVQVALRPILILKSFVVAKYLGPEAYGILKSVDLIRMLNKFGSLGFRAVLIRNAVTYGASGNIEKVQSTKNNAYSAELILSFVLFITGLLTSLFFARDILKISIILASIGLFTAKLFGIVQTELQLNKKFNSLSKIILWQGLINAVIVIVTVPFFKIYSVLIIPSVSTLFVTALAAKRLGYFFKFHLDRKGFWELLKVGMPFTIGTLAFGAFRYSERIIIITYLGLTAVGFFGFAETISGIFITLLLGSVIKVRSIKVYEELGLKNYLKAHRIVLKETGILIGLSLIFIILSATGVKYLIPLFLPKWTDAVDIVILFLFVVPIKLLSSYINIVVKAPAVNKLMFGPLLQLLATVFLFGGVAFLQLTDQMVLFKFLIVDLLAYAVFHVTYLIFYYQVFVKPYVWKHPLNEINLIPSTEAEGLQTKATSDDIY
ncbi:MAG: oligosaccharide flippase family protein [Calditrichales bacterium]|nr:oligosaccharide flippase family protein [Calditrichales bacterium]